MGSMEFTVTAGSCEIFDEDGNVIGEEKGYWCDTGFTQFFGRTKAEAVAHAGMVPIGF
jgi:hypothetical protein